MSLSEYLTRDFDVDEAIWMADLCHRASQVFASGRSNPSTLYTTLFADEWRFAHAIQGNSAATQVLIVRRANRNQWAVVFHLREQAERPANATGGSPQWDAGQEIPITNLEDTSFQDEETATAEPSIREAVRSAAYPPLPGELTPPPFGARVSGEWLQSFDACKDEIESFFDSLVSSADQTHAFQSQELELFLTGHGAGGCLAALCALYLKRRWESRIDFPFFNLKMYSFGAPRLGNRIFVDYYTQQLKGFSYCVQNLLDGATYEPAVTAPFPYNLQLLLPGVDYVRNGDNYHMAYAQIGELIPLVGVGNAKQIFHFKGPFQSLMVAPFAHGPEGYKQMLVEARQQRETYWKPVQQVVEKVDGWRKEFVATFKKPAKAANHEQEHLS
jgi:hypothetical protein